jgi:ubiquinone/menaquinone biosynthesis C-methylase UbiE
MEENEVISYYDKIAQEYDISRFANSYGDFIHRQEIAFFDTYVGKEHLDHQLDLGCGTGRFLEYASYGIDPSVEMIAIAQKKHSEKQFQVASGAATSFENDTFKKVYSFHVMMHLHEKTLENILVEAHRILEPKGELIFDFPSKKRRELLGYKAANWHGATSYDLSDIQELSKELFTIKYSRGFLFLPIHKLPVQMRPWFYGVDQLLCKSFLKSYSSYIAIILEKK